MTIAQTEQLDPVPAFSIDLPGVGDLEPDRPPQTALSSEWLLTNGLGGFAMGTVTGCPTRRYHGLLIGTRRPPVRRINALTAVAETLRLDDEPHDLSCFEFAQPEGGTVFHPRGWIHLRHFEKVPGCCRWVYEVGPVRLTRELRLVDRRNLGRLRYLIELTDDPETPAVPRHVTLELRPLVALRHFHRHRQAGDTDPFDVAREETDSGAGLRIKAKDEDEEAAVVHLYAEPAELEGQPQWWYRFHHRVEASRHMDALEDLLCPGVLRATFPTLSPLPDEMNLYFGTEPIDPAAYEGPDPRIERLRHAGEAIGRRLGPRPVLLTEPVRNALVTAADQFVVGREMPEGRRASIIAGYPWFADWGRDAMICLPGLLLCTGRAEEAHDVLRLFAENMEHGLIPNRFDEFGGHPHYNTVDGPLWFIEAAIEYRRQTGDEHDWRQIFAPACRRIIEAYREGTVGPIHMADDGLIVAGNEHTNLTWMDAKREGVAFTPRYGKAVEINALWHHALSACAQAMSEADPSFAEDCRKLSRRVRRAFARIFWSQRHGRLVDHVNELGDDPSLRCNQVFAVSLAHSPLSIERQRKVMRTLRQHLLTPRGLRTLAPEDPDYHGRYRGSMFERDSAYHRGAVWPWLIGPYVTGYLRAYKYSRKAHHHAIEVLRPLLDEISEHSLGQIHEIYSGDAPHRPDGCPAQAWSVAELIRAALEVEESAPR